MNKFLLLALCCCFLLAFGCAKKQQAEPETVVVESAGEMTQAEPAPAPKVMSPREIYEQEYANLPTSHTVTKGECLWWIAEYKQVYNDPFMWPLIFKANRDQIKNPDLIYPGQVFSVPRDGFDLEQVKAARKQAGAPWKHLEPSEDAVIPAGMRADLGYGF